MSPEPRDPSDPWSWLRRARSNLARARAGQSTPEILCEDLCFDAQQAAEKGIEAVLVSRGAEFPKTHVLVRLLDLVERAGVVVPPEVREAEVLA
ncbi:MAG: HEPN domain-containing protein, partial [Gemmatimonadetes bacterium]|nr:HEPN domain-containing protein [Gemmatimonadota bacterium]